MEKVTVTERIINIPTYVPGEPSDLPMFLNKRVYQGSSGKVYPHPVTDKLSDTKEDKAYRAIFLENEYLIVIVLPELGGRIQRILDKTNNYDAVYYNEVIKPALVGLAGPWISGGIEFNWPQHHRPSTFDPVDCTIVENDDGSVTVWCGEIEHMFHTKGMAGFTLYPGRAYLEIKGQLYNPTEKNQTFLWWANPAVAVNDYTQSIFPPDVHAVMDHGKRAVSKFPIATGVYYNYDYGRGVDISKYKNIPVPTSYMAYHSDYDFVGNYDFSKDAGLLHVADHHISPGKKQWTWGSGDFGKAWDRNLTDENGPYIELMTGMFTDNQPDFTFLAPFEEKTFVQYFMPYKTVGAVKNATKDVVINLETSDNTASVFVYVTRKMTVSIKLTGAVNEYIAEELTLTPEKAFTSSADFSEENIDELTLSVYDENGELLLSYSPVIPDDIENTPPPAEEAKRPEEIDSLEELYLTAVHLEQYRHATYSPEPYYLEGLRRDPTDIRLNNGYGKFLYNCAKFEEAIPYFKAAIKKSTWKNPNPYDTEPYYNLGITYLRLKDTDSAYDAFYKAAWSAAMQDKSFYFLACICAYKGDYDNALKFVDLSLTRGSRNLRARNLKTSLLRLTGRTEEAMDIAYETVLIDPLDFGSRYELYRLTDDFAVLNELTVIMRNDIQNYIELSLNYKNFGLYDEAAKVLALIAELQNPMLHYFVAFYSNSPAHLELCENAHTTLCFPNRLDGIEVLRYAIDNNPHDANAPYYLGCLYYDKGNYEKAIANWEKSVEIAGSLDGGAAPTTAYAYRNLAIAYFNVLSDKEKAAAAMKKAVRLKPDDSRLFFELDQLEKQMNAKPMQRLHDMSENMELVEDRDDLYVEYVTLLNTEGYFERAYKAIEVRKFHPWEGGEGKITSQYRKVNIALAKECMDKLMFEDAVNYLKAALVYPENLGEGKLITETDNDIYYYLGLAYKSIDLMESNKNLEKAAVGSDNLKDSQYYHDQPPEMYFFMAMAEKNLGHTDKASAMFNRLVDYGAEHFDDKKSIEYFAVSLPDFVVFDADLNAHNRAHCCHMMALGYYGKGDFERAEKYTELGLEAIASHQGLNELKRELEKNADN